MQAYLEINMKYNVFSSQLKGDTFFKSLGQQ
jgi:hypothetical protein